jgi:hypothetical protein
MLKCPISWFHGDGRKDRHDEANRRFSNFANSPNKFTWYLDITINVIISCLGKVKGTLVQALGLRTGLTAHRGSRGIALLFLDYGTRRGEGSASRPGRPLPPGKTRYPLYRRLGGPPGPVWTGAENLAHTGVRSPDRPARSQSLYRLHYPVHYFLPSKVGKKILSRISVSSRWPEILR